MRRFAVTWDAAASFDALSARAFLGTARAEELDDELEEIRERIARFPEIGHPTQIRGKWSLAKRRVFLLRSPFVLYYELHLAAERIVVIALRHERARPPKL